VLFSGPVASTALEHLEGSGVVEARPRRARPAPAVRRRCAAARTRRLGGDPVPLLNSPIQSDTIRALGAEPVDLSFSWVEEVNAGRLRGAESGVLGGTPPLTDNDLYVTANVVLWPKVAVFCFSQARFDALTDEQREWVTQAAELAALASVDATYDEDAGVQAMCAQGVRFIAANPDQLAALRQAVTRDRRAGRRPRHRTAHG
jgi:TRAP-type C4-dicarboxylate transport system substrate-binding protein